MLREIAGVALDTSAKDLSVIARGEPLRANVTLVTPRTLRSLSAGTGSWGLAKAQCPGAGCGKAVERAVWKVMLPSTFCTSW